MRGKDIITDGETQYAYAEQYEWNSRYDTQRAHCVVVLATGVERKTWRYGANPTDGVTVKFVEESGKHKKGDTITVRSAEIRQLWSEFAPARDAAAKARKERARAAKEKYDRELERVRSNLPENTTLPYWVTPPSSSGRSGDTSVRGSITLAELGTLLDLAYSQGYRDAVARYGAEAEA